MMDILQLLDRPVAFQRSFVRLGAGVTGALLLSQLVYWANRTNDEDGWVYKTQEDWESETGLTRYEQEGARKKLRSLGLLIELKRGLPAQLFYKVNVDKLNQLLAEACKDAEFPQTSVRKTSKPAAGKPANIHTEITTETTTEITDGGSAGADHPEQPQADRMDYQKILEAYHATLPEMATVQILTDTRKRTLRNFWKKFKFNETRWQAYLQFIAENCRWMLEDRPNGRGGQWRRKNFDYLITERCYVAVKEGRADDR
ncbi:MULTISPECIES: replication protein [Serratia]|uniref:replication protein n=1 Tax=Serratia TaxID=613 RepID=UPI000B30CE66|nr:replication protein [Serratia marcescens]